MGTAKHGGKLRVLLASLIALILVACSPPGFLKSPEASEQEAEPEDAPARNSERFPSRLSSVATDTNRTMTSQSLQAEFAPDGLTPPDGYRFNTVIVTEGVGSFQVATPMRYSLPWRYGTPFETMIADAQGRDVSWAEFWSTRLDDDENPRAVFVDTQNEDHVVAILVTLTGAPFESGEQMAELFTEMYEEIGPVTEAHEVEVNGDDGAYVEYTVPAGMVGGAEDRVQAQVLIPDAPNELLWGLTCDVPESLLEDVKQECADIAKTFRPLPRVEG